MRSSTLSRILLSLSIVAVSLAACKDDEYLTVAPPVPDASFVEEFDTATAAYDRGWRYLNVSAPLGQDMWIQGLFNNPTVTGFASPIPFPAHSSKGSYVGYIGTTYLSTSAGAGIISNWVVSPVTMMRNGDRVVFYTRTLVFDLGTGDSTDFSNRLQVRTSVGDGLDVGSGDNPGSFTKVILDINPTYKEYHTAVIDPLAYPNTWTRFEALVGGLSKPTMGRFAFRYFVEGGGSAGLGTAAAIDSVAYISAR
ncbi:MAG: choice-of-anchor J domain-containing protein [Gemmatimonadaceae bacterium]|nr:choice-of-anchor J domain-containing protein [Chitinophagaceae bacterium]